MRKRRKLANKMTIMVFAVLIAVSAFFYAPMEVEASSLDFSADFDYAEASAVSAVELEEMTGVMVDRESPLYYYRSGGYSLGSFDIADYFDLNDDTFYKLQINFSGSFSPSRSQVGAYPALFILRNSGVRYAPLPVMTGLLDGSTVSRNDVLNLYFYGKDSVCDIYFYTCLYSSVTSTFGASFSADVSFGDLTVFNDSDLSDYQNGYNAGYAEGETAGYGNGYSQGFTDGEASVDTDTIYDEAFQAGKDSVDTQSYYDAGYQAGYQVAYSEGYESGYDVGYQSAMDRIASWGADTSNYPLLLSEANDFDLQFTFIEVGTDESVISTYDDSERFWPDINFNPNHTYKLDFTYQDLTFDYVHYFTSAFSFWLYWGDCSYPLLVSSGNDNLTTSVFISGDKVGNVLRFRCDIGDIESNGSIELLRYFINGCSLKLYDMGPSGDTQNHIANQTDQLTNGYDDSKGNQVNSDLSTGLNEYETAENSLFATATTGMRDFTFFDFESVPAMITGMSFIGSIMGSWFNQAGGASGVGIVLSILFSVILVAMVLGLYRWYQSRGGKN